MAMTPQRRVAIVGRPNVGKSALFNRLTGRRIAIVHEESGVTRDRLTHPAVWGSERFEVTDTGGVSASDGDGSGGVIEKGIHRQVADALDEAPAAVLVTDITAGKHPLDETVARLLHKRGCPAVVAANKADNADMDERAGEFASLGFPVFPVSAMHGRGIDELVAAFAGLLPPDVPVEETKPLRVTVVGRPNVGKSSYINRLLRCDRVIVSDVPGTTRDSVDIPFSVGKGAGARRYVLTDTPGIRSRNKVLSSLEKFSVMRAERSIERSDISVLVLDAIQGPTAQDKKIASLILEHRRGCVLVMNKWDKSEFTQTKCLPAIMAFMPFLAHCPVVFVSALTGYSIRKSVDALDHVAGQMAKTLSTGELNRAIQRACARAQAPSVGARRLKIFYAVQTGVSPTVLKVFVNDPTLVRSAYSDYLIHCLRDEFGLEGAPVVLRFKSRERAEFKT